MVSQRIHAERTMRYRGVIMRIVVSTISAPDEPDVFTPKMCRTAPLPKDPISPPKDPASGTPARGD